MTQVPHGMLPAIVTSLDMVARPPLGSERTAPDRHLSRRLNPDPDWYRALFRAVGTEWLWFSRLRLAEDALTAIIHDPAVEIYMLTLGGAEGGLLELDFRESGVCELSFFGLTKQAIGHGNGRWLMNRAVERAWAHPINRFWVHTCTNDHPGALDFYRRSGFVPVSREIEIVADPRLTGDLPMTAAPHIPIL